MAESSVSAHPAPFRRDLKEIVKKFPRSERAITAAINELAGSPNSGDRIPGFSPLRLHKARLPLKEYGIGKSGGLRVILLVHAEQVLFVTIYYKGDYRSEHDITTKVKTSLREILADL